jgi:hypothetical protein
MSNYKRMPSGRQVRSVDTRHGWAVIHVMAGGLWEVSRGGKLIGHGSVWFGDVEEAKRRAENCLVNLIETEN